MKILDVLGKVIENPLGYILFGPVLVTGLGIAAIPYLLSGAHKTDYSGDGTLPFAIGLFGCVLGAVGSFFVACPLALFFGVPFLVALPVGYYMTLAGIAAYLWLGGRR